MPNPKKVLLVRTRMDDPTRVSYRWMETVKQRFEADGWQVIDLAVDDAVRANVEKALQTSESGVFLFYGHGQENQMIGQDMAALIDLSNLNLLKEQRVYVVACWTTRVLGMEAESVARFYLGYRDKVIVWLQPYDVYLEKCVNKGIWAMLDSLSCTIEQARQLIVNEYNHWIDYFAFGAGASGLSSFNFAADLRHNRDALAPVFGDKTATLAD